MKTNLTCGIVRDLLPLYADRLTGEESSRAIEAHLQSCEDCRAIWRQMTNAEPEHQADQAEIDYLKKVKRSRKRLLIGAAAAVLVICLGVFAWAAIRAARPTVDYDAQTETVIIYGKSGYGKLTLPAQTDEAKNLDAQDDQFHLSVYVPALRIEERTGQSAAEFLPAFLERTDKSLAFLREYLAKNAPDCDPKENAAKFVELTIRADGSYGYTTDEDRITLEIGNFYWHRDTLYLLALMDTETVQWQQIGYSSYLTFCVNPHGEAQFIGTEEASDAETYRSLGWKNDGTPEDNLRLIHITAWLGLQKGLTGWDTTFDSLPVTYFGLYTGPEQARQGNALSPAQATSFIAWLTEQYGFEAVSAYCFDQMSFKEAFGTPYKQAVSAWAAWLNETCKAN